LYYTTLIYKSIYKLYILYNRRTGKKPNDTILKTKDRHLNLKTNHHQIMKIEFGS